MLRASLIAFGWIIPIVTLALAAGQIYGDNVIRANGSEYASELWMSVVRHIAYAVQNLALSPLCFFGAYMLDKRSRSGK